MCRAAIRRLNDETEAAVSVHCRIGRNLDDPRLKGGSHWHHWSAMYISSHGRRDDDTCGSTRKDGGYWRDYRRPEKEPEGSAAVMEMATGAMSPAMMAMMMVPRHMKDEEKKNCAEVIGNCARVAFSGTHLSSSYLIINS